MEKQSGEYLKAMLSAVAKDYMLFLLVNQREKVSLRKELYSIRHIMMEVHGFKESDLAVFQLQGYGDAILKFLEVNKLMTYYLINNETGEVTRESYNFKSMLKKLQYMKTNGYDLRNYTLKDSSGRNVKISTIILD